MFGRLGIPAHDVEAVAADGDRDGEPLGRVQRGHDADGLRVGVVDDDGSALVVHADEVLAVAGLRPKGMKSIRPDRWKAMAGLGS